MKLSHLQDRFADALLDPDGPACELIDSITGPRRLRARRRVDIYRANVIGALTRALEAGYPVCRRILGEKCFGGLSRRYVIEYPSDDHDLGSYGTAFPDFLRHWADEQPQWAEFHYLPDLARLEQLRVQAWRAAEAGNFHFDAFAATAANDPESVRLLPAPGLGLLESPYPVDRLWEINRDRDPPAEVPAAGLCRLVVFRRHEAAVHQRIDPASFRILEAFMGGATLGEVMGFEDGGQFRVEPMLPRLIAQHFITGFEH
jgi:hypothetical protein